MPLVLGAQVDRYIVEALLGSGGVGKVYRAYDTRLQRPVALKVLEPGDGGGEGAALREARAAAAIHHPNVAAIFDVEETEGRSFIVMELVRGTSLRRLVGDASVEVGVRVRWLVEVAGALAAAHALGVIHRDVKPENVIVRDDGVAKVLDFGIARLPRHVTPGTRSHLLTLSGDGSLVGTPAYMAPEQIRGEEIDDGVDQFGWGVLAYELLTGALPWKRSGAGGVFPVLLAVTRDEPDPIAAPGVPAEVAAVVHRALSKPRADRFASIAEIAAALAPHASPVETGVTPARVTPVPRASAPPTPRASRAPSPAPPPPPALARDAAASDLGLRDPDFTAPVDLEAHLALLLPGATIKGAFFTSLLSLGAKAHPAHELCNLASVPERRYVAFRDYPMSDYLRLQVTVARALHRAVPLGEGLRRLGWSAFDTVLATQVGKTIFGVFGRDLDVLVLQSPKAYKLLTSCGELHTEKLGPGRYFARSRRMPTFLETYQVGTIEGLLRHCGVRGRIRIATFGLAEAVVELTVL